MIKNKAILNLNDSEYEILRCSYRFTRKIDAKGRPISGLRGGEICVVLESAENNAILSQMLLKSMPAAKGYIVLFSGEDNQCIRRIEFEKAYVCSHDEQMQTHTACPMITQLFITPLRLDVNDKVCLDRRWPETLGFHWQTYEEKEMRRTKVTSKEEEKSIVEIYWSYGKDRVRLQSKSRHYTDINLHVTTKGYKEGDSISLLIKRDDSKEVAKNNSVLKIRGIVDENEEIFVENVLKKYNLNL